MRCTCLAGKEDINAEAAALVSPRRESRLVPAVSLRVPSASRCTQRLLLRPVTCRDGFVSKPGHACHRSYRDIDSSCSSMSPPLPGAIVPVACAPRVASVRLPVAPKPGAPSALGDSGVARSSRAGRVNRDWPRKLPIGISSNLQGDEAGDHFSAGQFRLFHLDGEVFTF